MFKYSLVPGKTNKQTGFLPWELLRKITFHQGRHQRQLILNQVATWRKGGWLLLKTLLQGTEATTCWPKLVLGHLLLAACSDSVFKEKQICLDFWLLSLAVHLFGHQWQCWGDPDCFKRVLKSSGVRVKGMCSQVVISFLSVKGKGSYWSGCILGVNTWMRGWCHKLFFKSMGLPLRNTGCWADDGIDKSVFANKLTDFVRWS